MELLLTNGEIAHVDDEDYSKLSVRKWYCIKTKTGRKVVTSGENGITLLVHREILNYHGTLDVDHVDRNGLNNRKVNLRLCTRQENSMNRALNTNNTSGYKGVCKHKNGLWRAYINIDTIQENIGFYASKQMAAWAYNHAAKKYFGEFAFLNEVK